jgi:hypothetical protein
MGSNASPSNKESVSQIAAIPVGGGRQKTPGRTRTYAVKAFKVFKPEKQVDALNDIDYP